MALVTSVERFLLAFDESKKYFIYCYFALYLHEMIFVQNRNSENVLGDFCIIFKARVFYGNYSLCIGVFYF